MRLLVNIALAMHFSLTVPAGFAAEGDKPAAKDPAEPQITVRGAKTEAEVKARLHADSMLARCVIKPVMTDEEIALCSEAHRLSREVADAERRKSGTGADLAR
jgi:hypothetical protein